MPDDQRDLPGPFRHRKAIEVRFADTDAMGHVNNAVYHTYVESARTSYLEAVTGQRMGLGVHGEMSFILAESRMVYRSPAHYGEILMVETRVKWIGRSSLRMDHRITAPEGDYGHARLVAVCEAVLVHYDYGHEAPAPIDTDLIGRFEAWEHRSLQATEH